MWKTTQMIPTELTAENGAKAALIGEFFETVEIDNPDYCGCGRDACDYCVNWPDEEETTEHKIPVSWTTIKEIYKKAIEHFMQKEIDRKIPMESFKDGYPYIY